MSISKQIDKIRAIGKGHIIDSDKWREFADEIDTLRKMIPTDGITRLEIINHYSAEVNPIGRVFSAHKQLDDFEILEINVQDQGKTLKIFLT